MTTNTITLIAWFATGLTLSSFAFRKQWPFRLINTAGATVWSVWAILNDTEPVLFTNLAIIGLNLIWFARNRKTK